MERNNPTEWIKELKIALINRDEDKLKLLSKRELPSFNSLEEREEALSIINQTIKFLSEQKRETLKKMNSLKKVKKISNPYQNNSHSSFSKKG